MFASPAGSGWFLGVYWGPRPETVASATDAMLRLLSEVADCCGIGNHWQFAIKEIAVSATSLRRLVKNEMHTAARDPRDADIGQQYVFLSQESTLELRLVQVSCHLNAVSDAISNVGLMALPGKFETTFALDLLTCFTNVFDPDLGRIAPRALDKKVNSKVPFVDVGWLTYRSKKLKPAKAPASMTVIPIGDFGTAYLSAPDMFGALSPASIRAVKAFYINCETQGWRPPT